VIYPEGSALHGVLDALRVILRKVAVVDPPDSLGFVAFQQHGHFHGLAAVNMPEHEVDDPMTPTTKEATASFDGAALFAYTVFGGREPPPEVLPHHPRVLARAAASLLLTEGQHIGAAF